MVRTVRYLALLVILLGVVSLAFGVTFIAQGVSKNNMLVNQMREEKVTYLLPKEEIAKGNVIDTAEEAEKVANTVREHRRAIAPSYEELLGAGKFDPTNPKHVTYAQALNMENYLYLGVMGFGLIAVVMASGGFMIITALALIAIGVALIRLLKTAT